MWKNLQKIWGSPTGRTAESPDTESFLSIAKRRFRMVSCGVRARKLPTAPLKTVIPCTLESESFKLLSTSRIKKKKSHLVSSFLLNINRSLYYQTIVVFILGFFFSCPVFFKNPGTPEPLVIPKPLKLSDSLCSLCMFELRVLVFLWFLLKLLEVMWRNHVTWMSFQASWPIWLNSQLRYLQVHGDYVVKDAMASNCILELNVNLCGKPTSHQIS